ncbi:MAG: nuclear transport factor 2 family protein [Roseiflexaceae bacterium]
MENLAELIDGYFAAWNETDAEQRRGMITRIWSDNASYLDPLMQGVGHAGIDTMIQDVQERFVGHRFHRTSDLDVHHGCIRFSWKLAPEGGPTLVAGTDFGVVAADGRLQTITGFFDQVPSH